MQQIRTIIQLLEKGYSLRAISAEIGLSRQPVTLYAARLKASTYSFEALRQLPDAALAAIVYAPQVSIPSCENGRKLELDGRMPYFLGELKTYGCYPAIALGRIPQRIC